MDFSRFQMQLSLEGPGDVAMDTSWSSEVLVAGSHDLQHVGVAFATVAVPTSV